jgi:SAM-dependent methyltransferase
MNAQRKSAAFDAPLSQPTKKETGRELALFDPAAPSAESASHQLARARFGRKSFAEKYPSEYSNRWRDRREKACVVECLSAIPTGSKVLDLPCGTGRLTKLLIERGYHVTSADASPAMLKRAKENYAAYRNERGAQAPEVEFSVRDVLSTGFATDEFDGISCIRLFHHFSEAETRRKALRELGRICQGPIVVTFLNSFALDWVSAWLKARIRGRKPQNQRPIPFKTFAADIEAAGLVIDKKLAAHWGISSRWFLVLSRRPS